MRLRDWGCGFSEYEANTHIVGSCDGMSSSPFPFARGGIIGSIHIIFTKKLNVFSLCFTTYWAEEG
jgi:hypothetical protein